MVTCNSSWELCPCAEVLPCRVGNLGHHQIPHISNSCRGPETVPFLHRQAVALLKDETGRSVGVIYLIENSEIWFNTIFMNKKESIRYLSWIDPMLSKFKKLILKRNSNSVKWNLLPFEFPFWSMYGNISAKGGLLRGYTAPTGK